MFRKDLLILVILCLASVAVCKQSLKPISKNLRQKSLAVKRVQHLASIEQNLGETSICRGLREETDNCTDFLNLSASDAVALSKLGECEDEYVNWVNQCSGSDQKPKLLLSTPDNN